MHKKTMMLWTLFLLALSIRGLGNRALADETPANPAPATETLTDETSGDETLAVGQVMTRFYTSLNAVLNGDAHGMDDVWSHSNTVTYMGPIGGIEIGWEQVREGWNVQAEMKLGGHVEPTDPHVTVGNDVAVVESYELGSIQDSEGRSRPFRIRATSSLRKENGQWKMIGHHTDLIESLDSEIDRPSSEQPEVSLNQQPGAGSSEPRDVNSDDDSIDVSNDEVILKLED